jgi:hypothetical protein
MDSRPTVIWSGNDRDRSITPRPDRLMCPLCGRYHWRSIWACAGCRQRAWPPKRSKLRQIARKDD